MERFEHGGNIYAAGADVLDFSANINPLGLAPSVRAAIMVGVDDIVHYPDPAARELKAAIAWHYHVASEELVLGNGASELFYLFLQTVRPRRVLLPVPSFSEYERAALAASAEVNYYNLQADLDFHIDWENFTGALKSTDCVILGNPNNPTGTLITRSELIRLLDALKAGEQWLVVDESFLDFLLDDSRYTVRDMVAEYPQLFVVQSLTKFYALPGLRLGFGVAEPQLAARLNAGKDVWNVNSLAQRAGVAALQDIDYQQRSRAELAHLSAVLARELRGVPGLKVLEPSVNFILLDVLGTGYTSTELRARLLAEGVLVRDCANYAGIDGEYIRVAVRTAAENAKLVMAFKNILA